MSNETLTMIERVIGKHSVELTSRYAHFGNEHPTAANQIYTLVQRFPRMTTTTMKPISSIRRGISRDFDLREIAGQPSGKRVSNCASTYRAHGALPDYGNTPAGIQQIALVASVTLHITSEFG